MTEARRRALAQTMPRSRFPPTRPGQSRDSLGPEDRTRPLEVELQAVHVDTESTAVGTQARTVGAQAGHIGAQAEVSASEFPLRTDASTGGQAR